ncbi:CerR family C-terminal domain-containing protein [Sulfurospirillum halorespirans]|uniref:Putative DNA-binding transcriptional regulator n=1 Tax=Sulfurospirillum halorespirans DSM 13726 TaxID=1193502 RepID=A0A1D7TNJ8_9BACT|nr:CerR family C-terminal domain-containing protein [Sulfurospirillum halorespirans]AOO66578.1 putative DNA-binding transcriptional regulator [Sulfurospirillum halorespirans DSM 13726]
MLKNATQSKPSNASKSAILETAYRLFGERSLEDVSIRELAKEANVNISSIHYYYGSKEELYLAVVSSITEIMAQKAGEFTRAFTEAQKEGEATDAFYIHWLKHLVEMIARSMIGRLKKNNYLHRIIIREQMTPSKGFELLYQQGLEPVLTILDDLIARISKQEISSCEVRARTHTLLGQIVIFSVQQLTITQRMPFLQEDEERNMEIIIQTILENVEYILWGIVAKRDRL